MLNARTHSGGNFVKAQIKCGLGFWHSGVMNQDALGKKMEGAIKRNSVCDPDSIRCFYFCLKSKRGGGRTVVRREEVAQYC